MSYKEKLDQILKNHQSPQVEALKKMLEDDNERLFKYLDESNDIKSNVPMDEDQIPQKPPKDLKPDQTNPLPVSNQTSNGYQAFQNEDD